MIAEVTTIEAEQSLTLEQRRAFHRLPLAERRRLLALQAERAAVDYETEASTKEREEWQSGDVIEY